MQDCWTGRQGFATGWPAPAAVELLQLPLQQPVRPPPLLSLPCYRCCCCRRCCCCSHRTQPVTPPATNWSRAYAEKAKWPDTDVPLGWLRQRFDTYVPPAIFEMKKSFQHLVPLGTPNFVSTLCSILEVGKRGKMGGERVLE